MKKATVSSLKKKLDKTFSEYIRLRDNYTCFTCGKRMEKQFSQNGHFVPRQFNSTRYDERNNNCQCYACNMLYNGQPDIYALNLEKKYGRGIVKKLNTLRKQVKQFSIPELEQLIALYKQKFVDLLQKL